VQSATWKLGTVSISILSRQFDKTYVATSSDNQGRRVTMIFIPVNGLDGWVIYDVESRRDSLRAFLSQYRNQSASGCSHRRANRNHDHRDQARLQRPPPDRS
jgi:hypothetical protein